MTTKKEELAKNKNKTPVNIDKKFIKSIDGKDFILYQGLLDTGHKIGLKSIEVELVQIPSTENENTAICRATVITDDDRKFIDFGDANPQNTEEFILPHLIRMASTRAKARALRDMTNVGMTSVEELYADDKAFVESLKEESTLPQTEAKTEAKATTKAKTEKAKAKSKTQATEHAPKMSEAQQRAITNLSKRRGLKEEELVDMIFKQYGKPLEELENTEASKFIRQLQQAA